MAHKEKNGLNLYIDLYELMQLERGTHQENRSFGLEHEALLKRPLALLGAWRDARIHLLPQPRSSEKILRYLSAVTVILIVIALLFGLLSGIGLLRYNGSEPVNLLYFLSAVLLLPLVTMTMALLAMLRAGSAGAVLVQLSPAWWMESILLMLPGKSREMIERIKVAPLLANWIVIRRSQELALAFSLGLLLALLAVVTSEDIAFAWSTTLQITAEAFHHFLEMIALPWRSWLPQALPSIDLIEQSHYFRLGGRLSGEMVAHAAQMGEWWKFLLMTTLVYAVSLRFLFLLAASKGLQRATERAILSLEGVRELLREMREPLITTQAPEEERRSGGRGEEDIILGETGEHYESVIGWALERDRILLQNERLALTADRIFEAGGLHSLAEDRQVIEEAGSGILLYVKAWEPPTMDFVDFLRELSETKKRVVTLYPLGTPQRASVATDEEFGIWAAKIAAMKEENVRMIR